MITKHDLDEAILECQGKRNPDAKTCQMLAAFYIIKDHMFSQEDGDNEESFSRVATQPAIKSGGGNISIGNSYSNDLQWDEFNNFGYQSNTEFAKLANNTEKNALMQIIDELMSVLEATNPRLYNGVVRKLLDNQK